MGFSDMSEWEEDAEWDWHKESLIRERRAWIRQLIDRWGTEVLAEMTAQQLLAELLRRGWQVDVRKQGKR
jgi:hypothetical protein